MSQLNNYQNIGFSYLPYQWSEYAKMWRDEEFNLRWSPYRDKKLPGEERELIELSINQNIDATLKLMEDAVLANPLQFYCPTGDNEKLINNFAHCLDDKDITIAFVSCFSGNGIGKTVSSVNILLNIMLGVQNPWFDFPIFRNFPLIHKSILYSSESSAMANNAVTEKTIRDYMKAYPENSYSLKHSGGNLSTFSIKESEFDVIFRTYNQTPKKYESENISIAILDEPPPDNIWKAIKGRGRDGLIVLLNFTPINCPAYLMEEIERSISLKKPAYTKVVAELWGTTREKGTRGFRSLKEAEELANTYSIDEKEARVSGKPTHYFGRIYKNYDAKTHHYPINIRGLYDRGRLTLDAENDFSKYRQGERPWYMPDDRAIYVMANDPADGRPDAICWAAINPNGRYIFLSAYPTQTDRYLWDFKGAVNEATLFGDIVQIEQELGVLLGFKSGTIPIARRIIDSRFSTQTRGSGEDMLHRYKNFSKALHLPGRWVESYTGGGGGGVGEISYGHGVVREAFGSFLSDNHPKVVIWDWEKNHHLYTGLDNYVYKQTYKDGVPFGQTIAPKYKDMADAVRFLFCDRSNKDRLKKNNEEPIDYTNSNEITDYTSLV